MRVLLLGGAGQLGRALSGMRPAGVELLAPPSVELDLLAPALQSSLAQHCPQVLINAAAYTAVDRAESEPARAHAVNADAVGRLARWCAGAGVRMLHISTDYVFDGGRPSPRAPDDVPEPLNTYGATKLEGERQWLAAGVSGAILRTAWVYGRNGHNFVKTMLKLMREREEIAVVADQIGAPTWAQGLAEVVWALALEPSHRGVFHWSDAGVASWYDFAVAIQEEALALGLLERPVRVRPIASADYPTPARRPAFSLLDSRATLAALGGEPVHWRLQLRRMLRDYQNNGEE